MVNEKENYKSKDYLKKGQASTEYMMIVGFVFVVLVPLLVIFFTYTDSMSSEVNEGQINKVAKKIIDAAESVYFLGEPSQTTIKIYSPKGIENVTMIGSTLIYTVQRGSNYVEIVNVGSVNLSGELPATDGIYFVTVKATSNNVTLSYK